MENISWSEEQVLAVVNEFNDKMEELLEQAPKFQHIDFVKFALLYLRLTNIAGELGVEFDNEYNQSLFQHLDLVTSNTEYNIGIGGEDQLFAFRKKIMDIYHNTLYTIPEGYYVKSFLDAIIIVTKQLINHRWSDSLYSYHHIGDKKNLVIYVRGLDALINLITEDILPWENKLICDFDNLDDLYIYRMRWGFQGDMQFHDNRMFINIQPSEENLKFDLYVDHAFDFSMTNSVLEQLKPKGVVVAGVYDCEVNGNNVMLQNLFKDEQVEDVRLDESGSGWITFGTKNDIGLVNFYSQQDGQYYEIPTDEIVRYGYSLDYKKYDLFEKVDEFITTLINLRDSFGYGIGYDECMASLFLIPYFKRYYKDTLSILVDDYDPKYESIENSCIDNEDGPERLQVIRALKYCVFKMRSREWITEVKYLQFLNAIRMIDAINDATFQKYYPEVISRICNNVSIPSYSTQYHFVESQIGDTDNLQIVIRKDDCSDIHYLEDGEIEEQTSYSGWGSIVTPNVLKTHSFNVEMDFLVNNFHAMDPICSASQYVIFDALNDENKNKRVFDIELSSNLLANVIIDLHKDVRQYETISAKRLKPGGQFVTFVMKKDMESCQPVVEKLIRENVLDKVISLNNRYLLFINQSKQDDKVVLAKFNHIDDGQRWLETYPAIIEELSSHTDTQHVRLLSVQELENHDYSLSTDLYFTVEESSDLEKIIQSVVSLHRGKHELMDILQFMLNRITSLYAQGKKPSYLTKEYEDVIDSLRDYEETLMDHYVEFVDALIKVFGSDDISLEFFQPEVAKLMVALQDTNTIHKLYNPFAGPATFAMLLPDSIYYGNEINIFVQTLGVFRLAAHELDHTGYNCKDSLEFVKSLPVEEKYDTVLSIPPFMPKEEAKIYGFLFDDCMSHLEENGKMMVAVPSGFTFNRSPKVMAIRQKLVESNWVEKVIALPKGSFQGTNVSTCLIQLSKQPNHEILFCDASQMAEQHRNKVVIRRDDIVAAVKNMDMDCCFRIPCSDVANNHFSLNPVVYKPFPAQEGMETFKLCELLTKFGREKHTVEKGLVFTQDLLSTDVVDYRKSLSDLKTESLNQSMLKVQGDALLLSSVQSTLKPTYMEADQDASYYVNRNIMAFKVNTGKVMPAYLCYVLIQPEVLQQIDNYRTSAIAFVNADDFLSVRVNLPDMNIQRNTIEELARLRYAEKKQELNKMYGNVYAEKEEEFKSLKHAMGKSVAGINAAVDNLFNYFEKTGLLDKIVQTRRNTTVADKLNVIKDSIHHIEVLLQNGADFLDMSQYPLSSVSINEIWSSIQYETEKFTVNKSEVLPQSMSEVRVRMNLDLFKILINDVMSNAEKHAFFDNDPANVVRVEIFSDNALLTLLISNNGKPFPDDVDVQKFTKRHWSAGEHRGSGIGGHDIQKIVKAFQGEFELIPDYKETFPTCYVLRFPIE